MRRLIVATLAITGSLATAAAAAPPPVIIISIDTLRADRMPAYGYRGIRTPHLDAFRADAILFERAWSPCPLTAPAHASMLTGMRPPQHGVRDNAGYALDARVPTVAGQLKHRGYATGAMVSSKVLDSGTGLARGFDVYDEAFEEPERPGGQTVDAALKWLDGVKGRPFFLFVHLYEPHAPYRKLDGVADAYDAEIVRVDGLAGRLLAELRRRGLYDGSLIFFVSDHGEGLGDHGEKQHGVFLYRETLQVPLMMKLPGNVRRGRTVRNDAQLLDLAPTIGLLFRIGGEVVQLDVASRDQV